MVTRTKHIAAPDADWVNREGWRRLFIPTLVGLLAVAIVASLAMGAVALPIERVVDILLRPAAPGVDAVEVIIIWEIRFGRVVCSAETIFYRAHDPVRMLTRSFKIQDRVDDVLERFGTGQSAIFGDVTDQEGGHLTLFCPDEELRSHFANLADTSGSHIEFFTERRLDRVHYDSSSAQLFRF